MYLSILSLFFRPEEKAYTGMVERSLQWMWSIGRKRAPSQRLKKELSMPFLILTKSMKQVPLPAFASLFPPQSREVISVTSLSPRIRDVIQEHGRQAIRHDQSFPRCEIMISTSAVLTRFSCSRRQCSHYLWKREDIYWYSHNGEQCGVSLKDCKQNYHMIQKSHSWT